MLSSLLGWKLHPLNGICLAPILADDGSIRATRGYDPETRYWCAGVNVPPVPERPSQRQVKEALQRLRSAFKTFPFADASMSRSRQGKIIDLSKPPGYDETTYLAATLTAVCRPSLAFAPGFVIRAPQFSGAGTGKGQLFRAIARIAFDISPKVLTSPRDQGELDKRLTAALVATEPMIFVDNVNSETLRSNLLAQMITENPIAIRPFGENTKLTTIVTNAFTGVTGNAVRVSEDLARRFLVTDLDAKCESPETRTFNQNFLSTIERQRHALLGAALTIWRWGRRHEIKRGLPYGSFEQWAAWCRDPLLALGCPDPVRQLASIKRDDPQRERVFEFYSAWYARHGQKSVFIADLDNTVRALADPHGRGRQYVQAFVTNLVDTRVGGYALTRCKPVGNWGSATYALAKTK